MEAVGSIAIGVAIFVVAAVIYSRFVVKNATLESLLMLPDEQVLFEETGVKVRQEGAQRPLVFISCTVRATSHRIIVAQKALLSKRQVLRLVATYSDLRGEGADLSRSLRAACIVTSVPRPQITVTEGSPAALSIPLGGGALTSGQTMLIESRRLEELVTVLDRVPV